MLLKLLWKTSEMVILWAGGVFSKALAHPRGHMHAIEDITASLRTGFSCRSALMASSLLLAGLVKSRMFPHDGSIEVDSFYNNKWAAFGDEIVNPIGCSDCHDPKQ